VSLTQINGTWRFLYDGNWDIDKKFGWKNIEQIVNE
jgi:hypothetical protein